MKAMNRAGAEGVRYIRVEELSGQLLDVVTGNLRRAVYYDVQETDNGSVTLTVAADSKLANYGAIQEYGGTIRPVRSKFLAIPLAAVKTGNGVARFTARQLFENPSVYGFTGAFIAKGIVFGKNEKTITPLFVLRSSVTIKGVGYLSRGVEHEMPVMKGYVIDALVAALKATVANGE